MTVNSSSLRRLVRGEIVIPPLESEVRLPYVDERLHLDDYGQSEQSATIFDATGINRTAKVTVSP